METTPAIVTYAPLIAAVVIGLGIIVTLAIVAGKIIFHLGGLFTEVRKLSESVDGLRTDMGQFKAEVREDIGQFKTEVREDMGQLRGEMGQLRGEMGQSAGRNGPTAHGYGSWLPAVEGRNGSVSDGYGRRQ